MLCHRAVSLGSGLQQECGRVCRICLEGEEEQSSNPLISPCKCSGSSRWVHRECLQRWRCVCYAAGNPSALIKCEVCNFNYHFKARVGSATSRCASIFIPPHSAASGLLLGLMCLCGLSLGFVPILQMAYPGLSTLDESISCIAVHIANSVITSGLFCSALLHFGYPIPLLRSIFGALLMIYMLFILGPLSWWRIQQREDEGDEDAQGRSREQVASTWLFFVLVWSFIGLRLVLPAMYKDLQRVFLFALEGPFELEEFVQGIQQDGDRSHAPQDTASPRSCSESTCIHFLDWAAQQHGSALPVVPHPL